MRSKKTILGPRYIAINLIHHELIHIHDEQVAGDIYNKIKSDCEIGVMREMKYVAIMIWKEYYACRLSAPTYNWERIMEDFENLFEQIEYVYGNTEEDISEYRSSEDLDNLISKVGGRIPTLLNYAAYELGKLSYYKEEETIKEYLEYLNERLIHTFFYDTWKEMYKYLDQIFNTYPSLDSSLFDSLSYTILRCWNVLGIYPRDSEKGIHFSIPVYKTFNKSEESSVASDIARVPDTFAD